MPIVQMDDKKILTFIDFKTSQSRWFTLVCMQCAHLILFRQSEIKINMETFNFLKLHDVIEECYKVCSVNNP